MPGVIPDPHLQLAAGNRSVATSGEGAQVVFVQVGQRAAGTEWLAGGDIEVVGRAVTNDQLHPHATRQGMVELAHQHPGRVEIRRADDDLRARRRQQGAQCPVQRVATAHTQQRDHPQALPRPAVRCLIGHAPQPRAQAPDVAAQAAGGGWLWQVEARRGGVVQQAPHQPDHRVGQLW
ncbi:hypothetical protein D3C76_1207990 [compost metagenome]